MADTARSFTDLIALLADNNSNDITPQVFRDVLESIVEFGQISVDDGSTVQGSLDTTFAQILNFDTNDHYSGNITNDATNDEIEIGTDGYYQILGTLSFVGSNDVIWQIHAGVDTGGGYTEIESVGGAVETDGASTMVQCVCNGTALLSAGDKVALLIRTAAGSSKQITLDHGTLSIERVK